MASYKTGTSGPLGLKLMENYPDLLKLMGCMQDFAHLCFAVGLPMLRFHCIISTQIYNAYYIGKYSLNTLWGNCPPIIIFLKKLIHTTCCIFDITFILNFANMLYTSFVLRANILLLQQHLRVLVLLLNKISATTTCQIN